MGSKVMLVVVNVEINDVMTESIRIGSLDEVDEKVGMFCNNYGILDTEIVKNIKTRILMIFKSQYPSLVTSMYPCKPNTGLKRKTASSVKKLPLNDKKRLNRLTTDYSGTKIKTYSMLDTKRADNTMATKHPIIGANRRHVTHSFVHQVNPRTSSRFLLANPKVGHKENNKADHRTPDPRMTDNLKPLLYTESDNQSKKRSAMSELYDTGNVHTFYNNSPFVNIGQLRTPVNIGSRAHENVDIATEAEKHFSNYSKPITVRASGITEPSEVRSIYRPLIHSNNPDTYVDDKEITGDSRKAIVDVSHQRLKGIFDKLDGESLGYIGPCNISLRNLSADDLKLLKTFIIEIYKKDQGSMTTFSDFCTMINGLNTFE